jgi:hypothetical protein
MALLVDLDRSTVVMECATGGRLVASPVIIGCGDNNCSSGHHFEHFNDLTEAASRDDGRRYIFVSPNSCASDQRGR